jgi:hypothetical protein
MLDSHLNPHPDLAAFLLGSLDPGEAEVFEAHAVQCATCSEELSDLRRLPGLLDLAVPAVELPPDLRARTMAAVATADRPSAVVDFEVAKSARQRRLGRSWRWITAAAAVVLVVTLAVGALRTGDNSTEMALSGVSGTIAVEKTRSGWRIDLNAEVPRRDNGTYYEAFVEGPEGRVSVGTFNEGDSVVLWSGVPLSRYRDFVIVKEPGGLEIARRHLDL